MSKVYLLRVCAYRPNLNYMCSIYDYESILFANLKDAVKVGTKILKEQLKKLLETDEHRKYYKSLDEFLASKEEKANYIFEVEETDLSKLKTRKRVSNIEQEPQSILWLYDYKGNFKDRRFYWLRDDNTYLKAYNSGDYAFISFRPNDEKVDAGTKFKRGDIVVKKNDNDKEFYIIFDCPVKDRKYFANEYTGHYLCSNELEYLNHSHFHEGDIKLYEGEVPESIQWLSKFFKGEIKVSEEDSNKIWAGEYCFSDKNSYKQIKKIQ